jgi:hypothetical protein
MQENEFEQKLQQQMQQLLLQPGDGAWPNIAAQIAGKKKKRRWLIWACLAALLIAGGSFWVFQYVATSTSTSTTVAKHSINTIPTNINDSSSLQSSHANAVKDTSAAADDFSTALPSGDINKNLKDGNIADMPSATENNQLNDFKKTQAQRRNTKATAKVKVEMAELDDIQALPDYTKTQAKEPGQYVEDKAFPEKLYAAKETVVNDKPIVPDSIVLLNQPTALAKLEPNAMKKNDTANNQQTVGLNKLQTAKKWTFSIGVLGGVTGTRHGAFSSEKAFADLQFSPTPGNLVTAFDNSINARKSIGVAPGFGISLLVFRQLSNSWQLGTGIQYTWLQQQMATGSEVMLTVNNEMRDVRTGGNNISYNNHFHYIGIPLLLQWQASNKLSVDAGINMSKLVGSNALQYFETRNVYYTDNSLLNNTTFGLQLGASITLLPPQKGNLNIGPFFNYTFTPIGHTGIFSASRHWLAGIRLQKKLNK